MCGGMQEESAMGITPHKLAQRCNISDRHLWCVYVIWTILYMHTHAYTLRFFSFLSCCRLFFSYFVLTLVPCFTFLLLLLLVLILGLWNADRNYFWSDGSISSGSLNYAAPFLSPATTTEQRSSHFIETSVNRNIQCVQCALCMCLEHWIRLQFRLVLFFSCWHYQSCIIVFIIIECRYCLILSWNHQLDAQEAEARYLLICYTFHLHETWLKN